MTRPKVPFAVLFSVVTALMAPVVIVLLLFVSLGALESGPAWFAAVVLALALGGGEDYELLFTLRPRGPSAAWLSQRLGVAVTEIGRVVVGRRQEQRGWRHFAR